jgi:hypothetical protein
MRRYRLYGCHGLTRAYWLFCGPDRSAPVLRQETWRRACQRCPRSPEPSPVRGAATGHPQQLRRRRRRARRPIAHEQVRDSLSRSDAGGGRRIVSSAQIVVRWHAVRNAGIKRHAHGIALCSQPLGRTARPRLMTHASARIRQSSCHSRLLSAAGLPRRPTTPAMESLSSGSPHVTKAAKPTTGPKVLVHLPAAGSPGQLRRPGAGPRP